MSILLDHAKANQALGRQYREAAKRAAGQHNIHSGWMILERLAEVHEGAAEDLFEQAKAEATGLATGDRR